MEGWNQQGRWHADVTCIYHIPRVVANAMPRLDVSRFWREKSRIEAPASPPSSPCLWFPIFSGLMHDLISAPCCSNSSMTERARLVSLLSDEISLSWIEKLRLGPLADALQSMSSPLASYSLCAALIGAFLLLSMRLLWTFRLLCYA